MAAPAEKMSKSAKQEKMRSEVFAVMDTKPLEELTAKKVRRMLEEKFSFEKGSLDAKKEKISVYINEYVGIKTKEMEEQEKREESREKPPPAKRAKSSGGGGGGGAPSDAKNIKKKQGSLMSKGEFIKEAPQLEALIFGAAVRGPGRVFSSGNCGWYAGGKVEIPFQDKTVWVQVGLNVTMIGSKDWEDDLPPKAE